MKILAISDEVVDWLYSPAILSRCADVDLVVSCGDLPIWYLEFIGSALTAPCVYVKGNHDTHQVGEGGQIKSEAAGWLDLDRRRVSERGITLAGLEGCVRYKPYAPHQYSQNEQMLRAWSLAPSIWLARLFGRRGLDVLVAHAPPYGVHNGTDRAHTGFTALNWAIGALQPRLLLHGHQHRSYAPNQDTSTRVNGTLVLNVHPYRIIDLTDDEIQVV